MSGERKFSAWSELVAPLAFSVLAVALAGAVIAWFIFWSDWVAWLASFL